MSEENLKIIQLKAENIQNLKAIQITPDGSVVTLTGKNAAGKSSILDAIEVALAGKKLQDPIRHGEDKAYSEVDLGEYIVRRTITHKTDRLELLTKKGFKAPGPQKFLNGILGKLSFDPLEFADMARNAEGKRRQRQVLMDLVGLDFTALNIKRKAIYEDRSVKNRMIVNAREELDKMDRPVEGIPEEEKSLLEEVNKLNDLKSKQTTYWTYGGAKRRIEQNIKLQENNIEKIKRMLVDEENKLLGLQVDFRNLQEPENVTDEQIQAHEQKINELEGVNTCIRYKKSYDIKITEYNKQKLEYEELTKQMQAIDTEKNTQISAAQFPVQGLNVNDEMVLFEGIPFSQNSTGQKIKISTAIAMALNPKLKVILIRDGSSLDSDNLKAVAEMVQDKGYQLWIEKVNETGQVGIYIEEGEVKNIN